jgi:hypothetical protein
LDLILTLIVLPVLATLIPERAKRGMGRRGVRKRRGRGRIRTRGQRKLMKLQDRFQRRHLMGVAVAVTTRKKPNKKVLLPLILIITPRRTQNLPLTVVKIRTTTLEALLLLDLEMIAAVVAKVPFQV